MSDTVYLLIDGKHVENFKTYKIDSDMFQVPAAFQMEIDPEIEVLENQECEVYVNDVRELTGSIDKVFPSYDKDGSKLVMCGRDRLGWVYDACCVKFGALNGKTLDQVAAELLSDAPYQDIKTILPQENALGTLKVKKDQVKLFMPEMSFSQIEPGMTRFDVLKEYAKSCGLIFYCMPDGTFVFGKPATGGPALFSIVHRMDGIGNNVISAGVESDYSKRFSHVTVVGQKQGEDDLLWTDLNPQKTLTDELVPSGYYKPFVQKAEFGLHSMERQCKSIIEKCRYGGFRPEYVVDGHRQNGKNWTINEICTLVEEKKNMSRYSGDLLITGRTFEKSKERGTITRVRLGYKGMVN